MGKHREIRCRTCCCRRMAGRRCCGGAAPCGCAGCNPGRSSDTLTLTLTLTLSLTQSLTLSLTPTLPLRLQSWQELNGRTGRTLGYDQAKALTLTLT